MEGHTNHRQGVNLGFVIGWGLYFVLIKWLFSTVLGEERVDNCVLSSVKFFLPLTSSFLALAFVGHFVKERSLYRKKWTSYP